VINSTSFSKFLVIVLAWICSTTYGAEPTSLRPISFNGLKPGVSNYAAVQQKLGAPLGDRSDGDHRLLTFRPEGFAEVQIGLVDDTVASISLFLSKPQPIRKVVAELNVGDFRPAPVPDSAGELLGQVYPERGLLMGFAPAEDDFKVAHVVLEPISAEPFILRAQYDFHQRFEENLADLEIAEEFDPGDARIYSLRSRVLNRVGRYKSALEAATAATKIDPTNPRYALDRARLLFAADSRTAASRVTRAVAENQEVDALTRSLAVYQLGEFAALGADRDYTVAMKHHQTAIKMALPYASSDNFFDRRAAKQVLFEAHFAMARAVSFGDWSAKEETANKWMTVGSRIGDNLAGDERFDPVVRLKAWRYSLEALAGLSDPPDPGPTVVALLDEGERLLRESDDALYTSQIQWELGSALYHAARIQRRRRNLTTAQEYLSQAVPLMENADAKREPSPERNHAFGCLYFLVGSIFAVDYQEHGKAIPWYDKAALHFDLPQGQLIATDPAGHGERLVSMGVSFWETGGHRQALDITQQGLALMQQAVRKGAIGERSLVVPYGNLANMNRQLGYEEEAKTYAQKSAHLESVDTKRR